MSIFTVGNLEGLRVYAEKPNWKSTLNFIQKEVLPDNFFFFFDSERGQNICIFSEKISQKATKQIEDYLESLPKHHVLQARDPLFENFAVNSVVKIDKIPTYADIKLIKSIDESIGFQKSLSAVIIGALNYNDFFLEEKHRINIALQMAFLAMVRVDKQKILHSLEKTAATNELKETDQNILAFFEEIQEIEREENIENWVKSLIALTQKMDSISELNFIHESLCQQLEIRTFAPTISQTVCSILLRQKQKK